MDFTVRRAASVPVRLTILAAVAFATYPTQTRAGLPPAAAAATTALQRFLERSEAPLLRYRAFRHLEARNERFNAVGWLDAWTELEAGTFRYEVVAEDGAPSIRRRVLRAALETERQAWAAGEVEAIGFTAPNYHFLDAELAPEGLVKVVIKPRQKGRMMIDGAMFVTSDGADLVRVEGLLTKAPSFWTRRTEIVRRYARLAGVRVPVAVDSIAQVFVAGRSTFSMTYDYASINGRAVDGTTRRAAR